MFHVYDGKDDTGKYKKATLSRSRGFIHSKRIGSSKVIPSSLYGILNYFHYRNNAV